MMNYFMYGKKNNDTIQLLTVQCVQLYHIKIAGVFIVPY